MEYSDDEFLLLSGLQHFAFCQRQWALIHIEQQWKENYLIVEGNIIHEKCHDENSIEKRGDLLIVRGLKIFSRDLGISGICDVVEFYRKDGGAVLHNYEGEWQPVPIEYKHGEPKNDDSDKLQLCAQAICLEEMLLCNIEYGYLYYNKTHRREKIEMGFNLRQKVKENIFLMHDLFNKGYTPKVKKSSKCKSCSISDLCLPKLLKNISVNDYYKTSLKG